MSDPRSPIPRYIPCRCYAPYHFLRFDNDIDDPTEVTVDFVSTRGGPWWVRLKWAIRHVFGREDLVFADAIIDRDTLDANLAYLREQAGKASE